MQLAATLIELRLRRSQFRRCCPSRRCERRCGLGAAVRDVCGASRVVQQPQFALASLVRPRGCSVCGTRRAAGGAVPLKGEVWPTVVADVVDDHADREVFVHEEVEGQGGARAAGD